MGPWALKLSQLYDEKDLAKRKRNPRAKIQQTQAAQRLFNEYQITALRLRAKMTAEPLAMRCLAFPPSASATGKAAGYRYLAMRDAGSDLAIVTAALNAYRLPIGAVCAIGIDMVSVLLQLPSSSAHWRGPWPATSLLCRDRHSRGASKPLFPAPPTPLPSASS